MKVELRDILDSFFNKEKHISKSKNTDFGDRKLINVSKALNKFQEESYVSDIVEKDFGALLQRIEDKKKVNYSFLYKYAAIFLVMLVGYWVINNEFSDNAKPNEYNLYLTNFGETSVVELKDGTRIKLKENSELKVPVDFEANNRRVEFKGEAIFSVFHNPKSEFLVDAGMMDIKVLGTKFSLEARRENKYIKTILQEGKIEVDLSKLDKDLDKIVLKPNQKLWIDKEQKKTILGRFSSEIKIDLLENKFSFDNYGFEDLVKDLSLIYETKIQIEGAELKKRRFSAQFNNKSIDEVLETLQELVDFKITKQKKLIKLTTKN